MASYEFRLWFLLFSIVASWHHAVSASTDSSNEYTDSSSESNEYTDSSSESDDSTETNLCSAKYLIEPEARKEILSASSMFFYGSPMYPFVEAAMIKVYLSTSRYEREKTIFNELKSRIDEQSIDTKTHVIDPLKQEAMWSHFVRLLHTCRHDDHPALAIEWLEEVLSSAARRHDSESLIKTPGVSSTATAPKKARLDEPDPDRVTTPELPINLAKAIFFQSYAYKILAAVRVLHQLGIYHLDLKPRNMGLTHDGTLKLFDFDLACTEVHPYYAGTIAYSAPEMNLQLFNLIKENSAAEKLDIWSAGCTIYEIFTGDLFFDGIEEFAECVESEKKGCEEAGAYFYLKWSFGLTAPAQFREDYEIAEKEAQERCPQIFTKCRSTLEIKNPPVYLYSNSEEAHEEKPLIQQKMQVLNSDSSLKATYLDPSKTDPNELVTLLTDLLSFGFSERITALNALTDYSIFRSFPHQDATRDKFGNAAQGHDSSAIEHE